MTKKESIEKKAEKYLKKSIKFIQRGPTQPAIILTKEQSMLQELFNGERTFGTGRNLPVINETLTSGSGLIKSGDIFRRTGRMFGLR